MNLKNEEKPMRGKYGRLMQNTLILTVGTFLAKLLGFFMLPLYTVYLSDGEFGTADLVASMANFLIPIFCCGLNEGVYRFSLREVDETGKPKHDRRSVFSTSLVITLLGCLLIPFLLPFLAKVPALGNYAILVVLYVVCANLHSIAAEYLRACERTTLYSAQGVLNAVLVIVLNLLFLLVFRAGVYGYVLSILLGDLLTTVFLVFYARLDREFSFRLIRKKTVGALLKFSLPLVPGILLWWVVSVSDRFFILHYLGEEANGLYAAAAKIPTLLTTVTTVFLTAWKTSAVTEENGTDLEAKARKGEFFGKVYRGFLTVLLCMGAGITLFSKVLGGILLQSDFREAWTFIPILTVGAVFYNLSRFLGSVYFVEKNTLRTTLTSLVSAVVNVILNVLLIPWLGIAGAAIATLASFLAEFIVRDIDIGRDESIIRFGHERLRILAYGAIVTVEALLVTFRVPYMWAFTAALTVLILLLSAKDLFLMVRELPALLLRRSKK